MISLEISLNPGNFGAIAGSYQGTIDALGSSEVAKAISVGFLTYGQTGAYELVDDEAKSLAGTSHTDRGKLRYAYAGADPDTIGDLTQRLFSSSPVKGAGNMYSIGTNINDDESPAWSPTQLKYTDYVYKDRMRDAIKKKKGSAQRSSGGYAVGRVGNDVIYSSKFKWDFGTEFGQYADFHRVVEDRWWDLEQVTSMEVSSGTKSAISRTINRAIGIKGRTGIANKVQTGFNYGFTNGNNLMKRFMAEEMIDILRRAGYK
jgi:hypothetical protein